MILILLFNNFVYGFLPKEFDKFWQQIIKKFGLICFLDLNPGI